MNKIAMKKVGIWFLAFSLFASHVFFRSLAHAETKAPWTRMFSKQGECQIAFPSQPQMMQQTLPLGDGSSRLSYDVYLAPHEDRGVFVLLVATYPHALPSDKEAAGLEGLLSGIVNHNPSNHLVYADMTELHGKTAISFLVEGGDNYFRGIALMQGNKLYLVAMEGLKSHMDEASFMKFLKSFKLS